MNPATARLRRLAAALALALLLATGPGAPQVARAHATLVIGELTVTPDPPAPGDAATVRISLVDPLLVAVEKALVRIEFREIDPEDPFVPASITGTEAREFLELPSILATDFLTEVEDGVYSGTFRVPDEGRYTVSVRDTTFRNEEAIANIGVDVGRGVNGEVAFVLPPTPIGPRSLGTWLLWIIGIPVVAGLLVTFLALRRPAAAEDGNAPEGEQGEPPSGIA